MPNESTNAAPTRDDDLVTRAFTVRAIREKERSVDVICSTDSVDSYGDIVEQSWDLERYAANPIVLYNHSRFGDALPIGSARDVGVIDGRLCATLTFASAEANPRAEQVWQLMREKVLRTVSVGFIPRDMRWEMRDGNDVCVMSNNELHEISVVPIPANPEAVARMRARALGSSSRGPAANPSSEETMSEKTVSKTLMAAARLGLPADSEERAADAVLARAEQLGEVCRSLGLTPSASGVEISAKLAELSTAAAELPKATAERDALRAEKDAREATDRKGHIDALLEATPALVSARAALESFAKVDYVAFCKTYPKPANTAREKALTGRVVPTGGNPTPAFIDGAPIMRSHSEEAFDLAQQLMEQQPQKYAGPDGLERAMIAASRSIKAGTAVTVRS